MTATTTAKNKRKHEDKTAPKIPVKDLLAYVSPDTYVSVLSDLESDSPGPISKVLAVGNPTNMHILVSRGDFAKLFVSSLSAGTGPLPELTIWAAPAPGDTVGNPSLE